MIRATVLAALLLTLAASLAFAVPSLVEEVGAGAFVVRDDNGAFGGWEAGMGITHQNRAGYEAKKVLDLSDVPEAVWEATREVRLSVYFDVRDYSWHDNPPANGLDESYQIVVNGTVHTYPTNSGAPVYVEGKVPVMAWYDFALPKAEFTRGVNEIIIRKAPSDKNDDYLYLGIDNSVRRGNSYVTFEGEPWRQDKLTIPGGNGEYMVRLYLLTRDMSFETLYQPGQTPSLRDDSLLLEYVGARGAETTAAGMRLKPGQVLRLEWSPDDLDRMAPLRVEVRLDGPGELAWLDPDDKPVEPVAGAGTLTAELAADRALRPSGLVVRPAGVTVTVHSVRLSGARSYHPPTPQVDMCPRIAAPAGKPVRRDPACTQTGQTLLLDNGLLRCRFATSQRLRLTSLLNAFTDTEMLRAPSRARLFVVEAGGRRFTGSEDFVLKSVKRSRTGFAAELALSDPALAATLWATMDREGLRLGLKLTNVGTAPLDFKVAFPHLEGLGISTNPADDYYYYPWGGGVYSPLPAAIRRGYGDHEALYQVMDVYSPALGGGAYLRLDDSEGWHKVLALRKHTPGQPENRTSADPPATTRTVREEYRWVEPSLSETPGTGLAAEYLRRTRQPGTSFAPASAVLVAHPGDWHTALQAYSDWAHRVWKWRPYPSRLKSVHNMLAHGWGHDLLFRDGAYRTDLVQEPRAGRTRTMSDCIELMSWWDWSPLGPFNTPFDQLDKVLTPGQIEMWQPYFVDDPVTGQKMWNNQPNDYKGYNERFGGLPAFRAAIRTYQQQGALVTLYTDPFRLDGNCDTGRAHGEEWCVVGTDGKLSLGYEVYNPCHDLPAVREWVAQTMERVMRETGADGIRLDEYGHAGWACYSPTHQHTFAEPGIRQWNKAVAEATRMVHEGMDRVRPGLVLTTEHPCYDYLLQYLEGCITYDYSVQASPLRPVECNLQRFYFPRCKAYELDLGYDAGDKKKFWNAVESFGRFYPLPYYTILSDNEDVYQAAGGHTPLLWTPGNERYVYVNRFTGSGKSIYHLYNATGHTVDGIALAVRLTPDQHLFDLLNCEEAGWTTLPGKPETYVRAYIPRKDVACIAQLTRRLLVQRRGDELAVEARLPGEDCELLVAAQDGAILHRQPAKAGANVVDLSRLAQDVRPACLKLMSRGNLVDVAEVPRP
ncbi:MAG: hypothetical protein HPY69_00505 [Armatimonadetes bacterium]|nr:hypothetical protein [Armatimonadota bacterium]